MWQTVSQSGERNNNKCIRCKSHLLIFKVDQQTRQRREMNKWEVDNTKVCLHNAINSAGL